MQVEFSLGAIRKVTKEWGQTQPISGFDISEKKGERLIGNTTTGKTILLSRHLGNSLNSTTLTSTNDFTTTVQEVTDSTTKSNWKKNLVQ